MDTGRYAKLFLTESREYLSEINTALLELERGRSDAAVARLFRAVHTMKGMGAAMGYTSVGELSHELETLLDKLRSGSIVTPIIIDTLFAGVDAGAALLGDGGGPGLDGQVGRLDVGGEIYQVLGAGDLPDAGEIGLAVGAVGRGSGEINLAILGAGDAGGGELHPLRGCQGGGEDQVRG